jgi:hypothetical protein
MLNAIGRPSTLLNGRQAKEGRLRHRLMAAAALAPLCALAMHATARAQTDTISNGISTTTSTATAVSGGPGNIDIASGGSVTLPSGTAVTINSNNILTIEGSISVPGDNSTAIVATPGVISSITNSGTISMSNGFTAATNNDGYTQAPYATGTNLIAIQTQGAFYGSITDSGSITVQGNNSSVINIGNGLGLNNGTPGSLAITGAITLTGDHGVAVYSAGEITGSVNISSAITVQGAGSNGVQIGQVDKALTIYSTISDTGFATTTKPTTSSLTTTVQNTASQVQLGGIPLWVQGSVLGGIFLGAPPTGTVSTDTTTDLDQDGIVDSAEGTATLVSYGSAPALQIGGSTPITLGEFGTCNSGGPGNNCFGLIVEGSITGAGVYSGFSAVGADIGVGGAGVTILGGIRIGLTGTITASATQANATAVQLETGIQTPVFQNEGTIASTVTSTTNNAASAVVIQAGATVPSLYNFNTITASVTGDTASAYAIVDRSGTVKNFINSGIISASITPTNAGDTTSGATVALDLSQNTAGVTFLQEVDGTDTPTITGDVLLSQTGPNNVQIQAGSVNGVLSLGSGANSSIIVSSGASYVGALSYTGSSLAVTANGLLEDKTANVIGASSLSVGSSGTLGVALDPANKLNTRFNVSGAATFASGSQLTATLLSTPTGTQSFTIVQAGSLSIANGTTLTATAPYLFNTATQVNAAAGTVAVTIAPKTAAQLGLNKAEAAAYPAIYAALPQDSGIQNAIINAQTASNFNSAYRLMMPDSAGDVFETIRTMSRQIANASVGAAGFVGSGSVGVNKDPDDEDQQQGGLWASEFIFGVDQQRADNEAYQGVGLGLIGGVDFGGVGGTVSFASANITKPNDPGDSIVSVDRLEAGVYAAPSFGIFHTDMRVAAAYLKVSDRREFAAAVTSGDESTVTTVSRTANGSWNGYDLSGRLGVGAQFDFGRHFFIQPQVHADVLHVSEGAYSESGGGQGFDLNVSSRDSTETSMTASVVAGLKFGSNFIFRPQIELGWDDVLTGGPGMTTARFAYGGQSFTVPANAVDGGAGVLHIQLKGDGDYVHFAVEAGGEFRGDYQNADIKAVFRVSY